MLYVQFTDKYLVVHLDYRHADIGIHLLFRAMKKLLPYSFESLEPYFPLFGGENTLHLIVSSRWTDVVQSRFLMYGAFARS